MNRAIAASRLAIAGLLLLLTAVPALAQEQATVRDIVNNPGRYVDTRVEGVEGVVTRHVDASSSDTKNYILQGDSGNEIRVKTTLEPPKRGARYTVEGLVSLSPFNREPLIVEQGRNQVSASATASSESGAGEGSVSEQLQPGVGFSTIILYVLFGAVILGGLGYWAYTRTEKQAEKAEEMTPSPPNEKPSLSDTELGDGEASGGEGEKPSVEPRIKSESSSSLDSSSDGGGPATLKFQAPPKTMKFIPGKLVVAAGPDEGKEFRIAGHPTPEGNVVTIGRAEVEGERAFSHIQLGDTYRTVSRMQAEIVQEDQDIYLKNKSTTNPTMVNGEEVPPEEMVSLKNDDVIRMGELMLRYELE
jgi:hypothetical protein